MRLSNNKEVLLRLVEEHHIFEVTLENSIKRLLVYIIFVNFVAFIVKFANTNVLLYVIMVNNTIILTF